MSTHRITLDQRQRSIYKAAGKLIYHRGLIITHYVAEQETGTHASFSMADLHIDYYMVIKSKKSRMTEMVVRVGEETVFYVRWTVTNLKEVRSNTKVFIDMSGDWEAPLLQKGLYLRNPIAILRNVSTSQ